jgi:hypothetical protein
MGYTTDFYGSIAIDPPLNEAECDYLRRFAETRRMDRERGPYFVDGSGPYGQGEDSDVRDRNARAAGQPGLWCQWVPNDEGTCLEWDGGEKFYEAEQWMAYLITHFLRLGAHANAAVDPQFADFTFDHILDGEIEAIGEEPDDRWLLRVAHNEVFVLEGHVVYGNPVAVTAS